MKLKISAILAALFFAVAGVSAQVLPQFSTDDDAAWYFIKFACSDLVVEDAGAGKPAVQAIMDKKDEQLWKLVGSQSNFQLINKAGRYATVTGSGGDARLASSASPYSSGFSLVATGNTAYSGNWEIKANSITVTNNRMNQWTGCEAGKPIGFYAANDKNNPLMFTPESDFRAPDYTVVGSTTWRPESKLTLWYTTPATLTKVANTWMEYSLPIGNGQLGASLFNGVSRDQVLINEKTLWQGRSTDNGSSYGGYQVFGSLFAEMSDEAGFGNTAETAATEYYRALDLSTATGVSGFSTADGSVSFKREYIASNPDGVVAMHISASEKGKINQRYYFEPGVAGTMTYADGEGYFSGKLNTVSYNCRMKVVATGGTLTTDADGISVKDADEVLVIVKGATDYDPYKASYVSGETAAQLSAAVDAAVDAAAAKGWNEIYENHVADYQKYFNRVKFEIGGTDNNIPTNQLVDEYTSRMTATHVMLEELYFHYGRYLEIASSRGVDLPSNLQGIWNNTNSAPWNADIHANINVQMNYWPAEATNLSEMHVPFLNYITNMAMNHTEWQKYAKDSGQTKGWTCYTENNIFGGVGAFMHNYTEENAWYCTHLWQHYRYTLDKEFLAAAFPTMWSATEFWLERLKLDSDGTYVAPNEYSPEQGPSEDGTAHAQQLIYDLFENTLKAAEILGVDHDLTTLRDRFEKLDRGLATETYTGRWGNANGVNNGDVLLREWKKSSYTAGENGHRHMSHLMAVYPFSQITPESEFYTPAVNSMKLRGDASTGWSMGWKINLWARLLDGNRARNILRTALRHSTSYGTNQAAGGIYYNLYDSHSPFQIDGNFGSCAGIVEMFLQSQNDELFLFPAVPTGWKTVDFTGLKAVGDFTVDLKWDDRKPVMAVITSNQGQPLKVKAEGMTASTKIYVNGVETEPAERTENTFSLATEPGDVITVEFLEGVSIVDIADESTDFDVMVNGRTVTVTGDVTAIKVYDLQGRQITATSASSVVVPAQAGNMVLVSVTDGCGRTEAIKVALK